MEPESGDSRRLCYERVLRLVDLTVEVQSGRSLRKELLRWRELIAGMYIEPEPDPENHREAFQCLLLMTPESAEQIQYVCA